MGVQVSAMPTKERLVETIAFRVTPSVYNFLEQIAKRERRKLSEIATAFLERGIAAYTRDGKLFEAGPPIDYRRTPVINEAPPKKRSRKGDNNHRTGTDDS